MARSSCAVIAYVSYVARGFRAAPRAIAPGNTVAGGPTRATRPVSWSVAMLSGTRPSSGPARNAD